MKITSKILSIPPYISTTWINISSMHVKEELGAYRLIIMLENGLQVEIPKLNRETIDTIFNAHAEFAETRVSEIAPQNTGEDTQLSISFPLKGDKNVIEEIGPIIRHNPDQADLPPLPPTVLKRISAMASAFGADALPSLPKAEPDCNCIYCQVVNAVHQATEPEEEITEEDLKFRNWDVKQTADKLYIVTNPLDSNEHYSVFLGEPLGCTCGNKNCEHVRAVLSS